MSEGKSFHIHAPATGNARRPTVASLMAEHFLLFERAFPTA